MAFLKALIGKSKVKESLTKEKIVNVLVMGKTAVGKTSLIRRLVDHEEQFTEKHVPTVYEDMTKDVRVEGCNVTFRFMELGGKHSFPTMLEVFIKEANVYLLVYAADDEESHSALIKLREKIVSVKGKCYSELSIIIARNKVDTRRRRQSKKEKIRRKSVANWCYQNHDVSSKTGLRINSIMDILLEESKFIGNEYDDNTCQVSGRYIYTDKNSSKKKKFFKPFSRSDNKFDRANKRRLGFKRSNDESITSERQLFVSTPKLSRSLSLPSLRHSLRRFRRKSKKSSLHHPSSTSLVQEDLETTVKQRSCTWPELKVETLNDIVQQPEMKVSLTESKDTSIEKYSRKASIAKCLQSEVKASLTESKNISIEKYSRKGSIATSRSDFANKKQKSVSKSEGDEKHVKLPDNESIKKILGTDKGTCIMKKSSTFCGQNQLKSSTKNYYYSFEQHVENPNILINDYDSTDGFPKSNDSSGVFFNVNSIDCDGSKIDIKEEGDISKEQGDKVDRQLKPSQIPWMRLKSLSQNNVENIDMFTVNIPEKIEKKHSAIFKQSRLDIKPFLGSMREKINVDTEERKSFSSSINKETDKEGMHDSWNNLSNEFRKIVGRGRCTSFINKRDATNKMKTLSVGHRGSIILHRSFNGERKTPIKQSLSKMDSYSLNDIRYLPSRF